MQLGVNYSLKHSGQFLYKMSNELDGKNYAITRIALQGHVLGIEGKEDVQMVEDRQSDEPASQIERVKGNENQLQVYRLDKRELAPVSRFLNKREEALVTELTLLDQNDDNQDLILPKNITTLVEADFNVKIIQF